MRVRYTTRRMEMKRTGMTRMFKTREDAVVHIQRTFRQRKLRNLEKAAMVAMTKHGETVKTEESVRRRLELYDNGDAKDAQS